MLKWKIDAFAVVRRVIEATSVTRSTPKAEWAINKTPQMTRAQQQHVQQQVSDGASVSGTTTLASTPTAAPESDEAPFLNGCTFKQELLTSYNKPRREVYMTTSHSTT